MDTLGRYTIFEDQAEGSWRWRKAFNHSLRCYVALGVIPKAVFPSEQLRHQFEAEVLIANSIHHPNVASTFPLEVVNDSYLYAMEFCNGEALAARTRQSGSVEPLEAMEITRQIAASLEAASSAGLLHRNITADDIIVLEEDDEISVKVCGLALPGRSTLKDLLAGSLDADFRSPEEIAGKEIDVRSGIYSLGALLYFMTAGLEGYRDFRARSLASETQNLLAEQVPHRVRMVLRRAVSHDVAERYETFAELIEEIDRARTAPEQPEVQEIVSPVQANEAVVPAPPAAEIERRAVKTPEPREGELTIPTELLNVAQPGTVLRLNRAASQPEVLVWVGNTFRIGRAADAHLVTRFLPRNKTNDLQTKRLSITHATIRCEGSELLLSDGSGLKPSSNGSAFDGKKLSSEHPVRLLKPGELKLANAYAIRVIPLLADSNEAPAIANLGDWSGRKSDTNAPLTGALLFIPNEKSDVLATLWLFSTAAFGDSSVSPIDFTSSPKIAALRYLRGCFWIEQQSTQSLLVNELPLARGEIAPLVTGQTLEVKGSRYAVEIQDPGKQQKA